MNIEQKLKLLTKAVHILENVALGEQRAMEHPSRSDCYLDNARSREKIAAANAGAEELRRQIVYTIANSEEL